MKTARVITTFRCSRKCAYCVNDYEGLISQAVTLNNPQVLSSFDEICVTGGEPTLYMGQTITFLEQARKLNPQARIYVYASTYTRIADLDEIMGYAQGIHYTLHAESSVKDIVKFEAFQRWTRQFPGGSFRLYVSGEVEFPVTVIPRFWTRVQMFPFKPEGECELPAHEMLFVLPSALGHAIPVASRPILSNKIHCRACLDVVESRHRHDCRMCSCGAVGADGGRAYLRRLGDVEDYEELSTFAG
tara:strand:- start:190 stop:924 length:735 start_codon:yes stop_codon:yes gene_type:complete